MHLELEAGLRRPRGEDLPAASLHLHVVVTSAASPVARRAAADASRHPCSRPRSHHRRLRCLDHRRVDFPGPGRPASHQRSPPRRLPAPRTGESPCSGPSRSSVSCRARRRRRRACIRSSVVPAGSVAVTLARARRGGAGSASHRIPGPPFGPPGQRARSSNRASGCRTALRAEAAWFSDMAAIARPGKGRSAPAGRGSR